MEVSKMAECPTCGANITIPEGTETNQIITCPDCGSELEVTGPDAVKPAPQEEEDWGE